MNLPLSFFILGDPNMFLIQVFNCLVDNSRIDQIALAKDRQKSEEALIYTNNGEKAIKGIIKQVYCFPKGTIVCLALLRFDF